MNTKKCERWYGIRHDWGLWSEISSEPIENISYNDKTPTKIVVGRFIIQKRTCLECGLAEYKMDKIRL